MSRNLEIVMDLLVDAGLRKSCMVEAFEGRRRLGHLWRTPKRGGLFDSNLQEVELVEEA